MCWFCTHSVIIVLSSVCVACAEHRLCAVKKRFVRHNWYQVLCFEVHESVPGMRSSVYVLCVTVLCL